MIDGTMRIGVFDSGVGGMTVLSELRKRFPRNQFVYLGDTAHVPYGTRSAGQIKALASNAVGKLKSKNVDALVVACNTASSLAFEEISEVMGSTPVLGVVEAGVSATISAYRAMLEIERAPPAHSFIKDPSESKTILILATRATVKSGIYSRLIRDQLGASANINIERALTERSFTIERALTERSFTIVEQACPLLVPMIEEGWLDHDILHRTIAEYVKPYASSLKPGVALLACTHYPWIEQAFSMHLPGWTIVNSATAVADQFASRFPQINERAEDDSPNLEWIFTDPEAVPKFALDTV